MVKNPFINHIIKKIKAKGIVKKEYQKIPPQKQFASWQICPVIISDNSAPTALIRIGQTPNININTSPNGNLI